MDNIHSKSASGKKPFYKQIWFWVVVVIVVIAIGAGASSDKSNNTNNTSTSNNSSTAANTKKVKVTDFSAMNDEDIQKWCSDNGLTCKIDTKYSDTVAKGGFVEQSIAADTETTAGNAVTVYRSLGKEPTTEQKNALNQADTYANKMHMSKQGLYDQLTSQYGGQFSADAAQYAIDNVQTDWNKNALESAKTYYEQMNMSKSAVYDQLVSQYGGKFTAAEAQYAIDNLQ